MIARLSTFSALFGFGWRMAASEKVILLFGMAYNSLFVFLFSCIWKYTPFADKAHAELNFINMVWYVTISELVMFSSGQFMQQVRLDIHSQQLVGLMGRPFPYWSLKMLQLLGRGILNVIALAAAIFTTAYVITGYWPFTLFNGLAVMLAVFMALLIACPASFAIGMFDVWGHYARPAYWIWQKSMFVFGGLMLPLSLYPLWMQKLADVMPFPAMVNLPATMVFYPDASGFLGVFIRQIFWAGILFVVAIVMYRAARYHIGKAGD